ncbi:MAG: hypothetical protein WC450_04280 [Candidatus Omnitrophota bacterium]|jgi:hypothetical protein
MPRKKKKVVWHKKRAKFIPSSSLKANDTASGRFNSTLAAGPATRPQRDFKQNLVEKIRRAAQNG